VTSVSALAAVACAASAAPGHAQGTGGGGAEYVATPVIAKVTCVQRCASRKRSRPGSTIRVTGTDLGGVTKLTFLGTIGRGDDVSVPVRGTRSKKLYAKVPMGASTGPVSAYVSRTLKSRASKSLPILPPPPPEPNTELTPVPGATDAGAPRIETGTSRTKVFYGARRAVTFSYRVTDSGPVHTVVELIRASDGAPIKSWDQGIVAPGEVRSVTWGGKTLPGRYSFRLTAEGQAGGVARSAQAGSYARDAFDLYDHVFPVRGRHDYGGAGADFGSGRSGHSHQGHDVFAKCGTRMVAARGGKVQYAGYHGAAGNYIVIDGAGTGVDYTYMHLAEPTPFRAGDRVYTGQQIGAVGETGNARGCHLHFELWGSPGWYDGGKPFDPEDSLRAWDSWS
jgi:murein DD-endopeptidase MepM/ murein hydrolase activator NlpD